MEITPSIIISIAALIVAIFVPFINAILNNRHSSKMYKQRFANEHKADVIEKYMREAGEIIQAVTADNLRWFGSAHGEMMLFADDEIKPEMQKLYSMFLGYGNRVDQTEAASLLQEISHHLSKQSPRLK
mgnify:CR=1 FL=1